MCSFAGCLPRHPDQASFEEPSAGHLYYDSTSQPLIPSPDLGSMEDEAYGALVLIVGGFVVWAVFPRKRTRAGITSRRIIPA